MLCIYSRNPILRYAKGAVKLYRYIQESLYRNPRYDDKAVQLQKISFYRVKLISNRWAWELRALRIWGAGQAVARKELNMESTRKLSKFDFQWTKTLSQNNLKNIAFFFTFFKSYRCLLVICNNTKKNFSWEPEKINVKLFKLFWNKVFVHWKLKLLNFLRDSVFPSQEIRFLDTIINPFNWFISLFKILFSPLSR